ncbi:PotD/PotF family extracellular solute-binding protein [Chitinimonas sp. BJYL2]|uniref:ABC transporter substrate-binding protein n=1 Tax=Chitinimonas sp. BJYL2 TaxID=2976696 RepID=UPI0022B3FD01|nr:ABC transporter substrate-binding protein [Chitinimonas sp. BJYL2]
MRVFLLCLLLGQPVCAQEVLRIFSWPGYVTPADLEQVNRLYAARGLAVRAELITPYAEGPEQMFKVMREGRADVSFLTLNYLQMQQGRTARLLQPINPRRLSNYARLRPELTRLPMGMTGDRPLYVPFGGGAYGIWANMDQLRPEALPRRLTDLLEPRWTGKLSLTSGQVQPNVALAFLAVGLPPFELDNLVQRGQRVSARQYLLSGEPRRFLHALYRQVGQFWVSEPRFDQGALLVASYGPEIAGLRARGQHWALVRFAEGHTVWLDTMNILARVRGAKLDAAYLFIDHMLSDPVQRRVVEGLSMVAVTTSVKNPLLEADPSFFRADHFWPPYDSLADNLMRTLSDEAMRKRASEPAPAGVIPSTPSRSR